MHMIKEIRVNMGQVGFMPFLNNLQLKSWKYKLGLIYYNNNIQNIKIPSKENTQRSITHHKNGLTAYKAFCGGVLI